MLVGLVRTANTNWNDHPFTVGALTSLNFLASSLLLYHLGCEVWSIEAKLCIQVIGE